MDKADLKPRDRGVIERYQRVKQMISEGNNIDASLTACRIGANTWYELERNVHRLSPLKDDAEFAPKRPGRKPGTKIKPKLPAQENASKNYIDLTPANPSEPSDSKIAIVFCTAEQAKKLIGG